MRLIDEIPAKLGSLPEATRDRWTGRRLERLEDRNNRLSREVRQIREELERERSFRKEALEALGRLTPVARDRTPRRRGRLLRTVVFAGSAYLLGARAGRERYEQMRSWFQRLVRRGEDAWSERGTSRSPAMEPNPVPRTSASMSASNSRTEAGSTRDEASLGT